MLLTEFLGLRGQWTETCWGLLLLDGRRQEMVCHNLANRGYQVRVPEESANQGERLQNATVRFWFGKAVRIWT